MTIHPVRMTRYKIMKTIEVTDEAYNGLIEISKQMNSQSHRGTAMPYFFQVQTKKQIAVPEGNGIEAWYYDGCLIETEEEIEEAIKEYKGWDEGTTEFNHLEEYEIENLLEEAGFSKVNYDYEYHAFRNPEMELVSKFLCQLTGGEVHK